MSLGQTLKRVREVLATHDPKALSRARQSAEKGGVHGPWKARYTAWLNGVIRRRRTLQVVLGASSRRALKGKAPGLQAALWLGAYRILFEGIPWEQAQQELKVLEPSKKGRDHLFRTLEALGTLVVGEGGASEGGDEVLPVGRDRSVRFKKPLLEVSGRRLAARLGILHSLPDGLAEAWIRAFGEAQATDMAWAANDPPPLFGRVNPLRASRGQVLEALAAAEVPAEPVGDGVAFRLRDGSFRDTEAFREGWFVIQDLTAQAAAHALQPRPGERVLDLCAAPGTKTMALAAYAEDQADVLACDLKFGRLKKVEGNAARLGVTSVRTRCLDGRRGGVLDDEAPFDAVLVDAPCSNSGVLRRRPEARWRYDRSSQRRLARDQAEILAVAAAHVRPGGRLVYSVCSVEVEEGSGLIAEAREGVLSGWELEEELASFPRLDGGDGGYHARLRRPE